MTSTYTYMSIRHIRHRHPQANNLSHLWMYKTHLTFTMFRPWGAFLRQYNVRHTLHKTDVSKIAQIIQSWMSMPNIPEQFLTQETTGCSRSRFLWDLLAIGQVWCSFLYPTASSIHVYPDKKPSKRSLPIKWDPRAVENSQQLFYCEHSPADRLSCCVLSHCAGG